MKIDSRLTAMTGKQSSPSGVVAPKPPMERVATYLRGLALRGKGCTSNNSSIASCVDLSVAQVRSAKMELIRARRLVGAWQVWVSIDGLRFSQAPVDEIETLKTALRRLFSPVVDARTIDCPNKVAEGQPSHLIIGQRRVTLGEAVEIVASITASRRTDQ